MPSFDAMCLDIHMEIAEFLGDADTINLILALSSNGAVTAYIRELRIRRDPTPEYSPNRLKSVLLWAYALVSPEHLRHIITLLPPTALHPPTKNGELIPIPGGVNQMYTELSNGAIRIHPELAAKIPFGGCGAMCLAAAEGNLAAIGVLLEHWDWLSEDSVAPLTWACLYGRVNALEVILRDMRARTSPEQRVALIASPTRLHYYTGLFYYTPIDCALFAMHTPTSTDSGRQALQLLIAEASYNPDTLANAKIRAAINLLFMAELQLQWDPDNSLATFDAMFDALAPLPESFLRVAPGISLPVLIRAGILGSVQLGGIGARMRLFYYATRYMALVSPSNDIASLVARHIVDPEVLELVGGFVPGGVEALRN
ncbi:hypothetical protein FN846DRAFT_316196 [Sphaerosporella brunnea]|uniref:Ankyrin repeat-containing domain protein n=1 Tax=Sphaerosporella brunnea TaxID=1250544 RepID=A0A5J5EM40_9PEZI|nr:hypothetical protein FN846DRAFT_316196 [Sphaerosporella brunnea]